MNHRILTLGPQVSERDVVVFLDSFDEFVFPALSELLERFAAFKKPIVFGSGDSLFPDLALAGLYADPSVADAAFGDFNTRARASIRFGYAKRFLNGGSVAGAVGRGRLVDLQVPRISQAYNSYTTYHHHLNT
jgi:hypothetical protein